MPISRADVANLGKDPNMASRIPPELEGEYGPGFLAVPEVAHQLHCLNVVRKYMYFDHYVNKADEPAFQNSPTVLRAHIGEVSSKLYAV